VPRLAQDQVGAIMLHYVVIRNQPIPFFGV
jgi:hypothetical protein